MSTGAELIAAAVPKLSIVGISDPARDARRLLAHALGIEAGRLTLVLPDKVDAAVAARFGALVEQRARRVPVSHLTGQRLFYGRSFHVTEDVLDPRPETEMLVEAALERSFGRVLDLGTGSGAILLTLLAETGQEVFGIGTDLSGQALSVAMQNAARLGLTDRAKFLQGDWYAALRADAAPFDLIVSNPPYISAEEMLDLEPEVRDFEPRMALTDEADGLSCYRAIAAGAGRHLKDGGWLMVEVGPRQGASVAQMMMAKGFATVSIRPDLDGRDRVVMGQKPRIRT